MAHTLMFLQLFIVVLIVDFFIGVYYGRKKLDQENFHHLLDPNS